MKIKNLFIFASCCMIWLVLFMGALTNDFDVSSPGGFDDPREADDRMRETKAAVQERMNDHNGETDEGDHFWPLDDTDTTEVKHVDTGQHRMVTLRQLSDNPSTLTSYATTTDLGFLYQKNISSNGELFWEDEADNVLQLTTEGLFNLNSAIWAGVFATNTDDGSDSSGISLAAGGAAGVARGGGILMYGNEHASYPGQIKLVAGYSAGTTKAIIDASTSKISNVVDPVADQDAATKKYVDDEFTDNAPSLCKAWLRWTVSGTTYTIEDSYNVTSLVRNAQGQLTVTFTTAFANDDYAVSGVVERERHMINDMVRTTSTYKFRIRFGSDTNQDNESDGSLMFMGTQ